MIFSKLWGKSDGSKSAPPKQQSKLSFSTKSAGKSAPEAESSETPQSTASEDAEVEKDGDDDVKMTDGIQDEKKIKDEISGDEEKVAPKPKGKISLRTLIH